MNTNGISPAIKQSKAVSILDAPQQQREAWRLLAADQSNARDIAPDRWRLLAVAFANTPDDVLTRAVLAHMAESPHFPRLSDLKRQIDLLAPPGPFQIFCQGMARAGYAFIEDDGETAVFVGNGITPIVHH